jgi:hypothetical protein
MVEMVQKHTVKGTENYMTISGIVDRTRQMLQATNEVSGPFVSISRTWIYRHQSNITRLNPLVKAEGLSSVLPRHRFHG